MATAPTAHIFVPATLDFGNDAFFGSEDLRELGGDLIEMHPGILGHLADVEIAYLWKKSGGKKSGALIFGKTMKPSGVLTVFTTAQAVIWLAADHVVDAAYTQRQIEALLFHEMQHIGVEEDDETGTQKIVMRGHDAELFFHDVKVYGAWEAMLSETADAFKQAGLI